MIFSVKDLNIKLSEKGISGFNKELGGFFLVDRESKLDSLSGLSGDTLVEVTKVREIRDKNGRSVGIYRISLHEHKWIFNEVGDDFCMVCLCGEKKPHEWEFVGYEISDDTPEHLEKYRCSICEKVKKIKKYHHFVLIHEDEYKRIKVCKCGKRIEVEKAAPFISSITVEEIRQEMNSYREWYEVVKEATKKLDKIFSLKEKIEEKIRQISEEEIEIPTGTPSPEGALKVRFYKGRIKIYEKELKRVVKYITDKEDGIVFHSFNDMEWVWTEIKLDKNKDKVESVIKQLEEKHKNYEEKISILTGRLKKLDDINKILKEKVKEEYKIQNKTISKIWSLRTDPIFEETYKKMDPYDGFFGGIGVNIENFLKALLILKGARE